MTATDWSLPEVHLKPSETLAGVVSAAACVYAGLPFDVVKTRIQAGGGGLRQCVGSLLRVSGPRGFYAGALPALASQVAENAALFTANGLAVRAACRLKGISSEEQLVECGGLPHYFCGAFAGFFSATTICCIETVKVRLQVQHLTRQQGRHLGVVYAGPGDCFVKTLQSEGVRGLFRGLTAMWVRDIPFNAFFLGGFEMAASCIAKASGVKSKAELNPAQLMAAGAFAGTSGWALIFPVDVIKTRMQSDSGVRQSFLAVMKVGLKEHGVSGFYRGCSAAMLRSMPANAAMFVTYEYCMRWFRLREQS
ncbi:unnamed protein product [Polarella glacialis]|uniref:Mitochondrial carrier protein n=1 Tax=Polarella glacialis TaxID=89957 RepID=A0A813LKN9_POLGL|nr:unnamed protein product [Polarella glacialis]CAE8726925.1 unnamed protein product [Polarella glacialis]